MFKQGSSNAGALTQCLRRNIHRVCKKRLLAWIVLAGILVITLDLIYLQTKTYHLQKSQKVLINGFPHQLNRSHLNITKTGKQDDQTVHTFLNKDGQIKQETMAMQDKPRSKPEPSDAALTISKRLKHSPLSVLAGKNRSDKGMFTIGIPSVYRPATGAVYVLHTLGSIIRATTQEERAVTTIVILLTDFNTTFNTAMARSINGEFGQYCEAGFIRVIELSPKVYPDLDNVRQTYNDSRMRLKWRAKQNIDFAYLMMHSQNISKYYLQLEDDVIAANGFIGDMIKFIHSQSNQSWFLLEFSYLGFIGKLFKSSDLLKISAFLLENYDLAPCDLLLGVIRSQWQELPIFMNTTLFQHVGKFSSLRNKLMPSVDVLFKDKGNISVEIDEIPKGYYPPTKIETNLETYLTYTPFKAFDGNLSTYFWGKSQEPGSMFTLIFQTPQNFSRILLLSGHPNLYHDRLSDSFLEGAPPGSNRNKTENQSTCGPFKTIVQLVDGHVDTIATGSNIPRNIVCLRLLFTRTSNIWAIIREIILVR